MKHKYYLFCLLVLIITLAACTSKPTETAKKQTSKNKMPVSHDLEEIKKEGVLKVVTTYSSTSYFLYKGQAMGYEFELLERFADHLGVKLQIEISNEIESMYSKLLNKEVDLIAHGLTITQDRKKMVQFSDYLYLTRQVLVQKKPDNWRKLKWSALQKSLIHDAIELIGDTVSVRANSSYIHRLANLSDEMGGKIHIDTLPSDLSTDRIIQMVVNGEIKYTVADDNIASINASYFPILNIEVPISFSQRLAWAMRPDSKLLGEALNEWIAGMKKETVYYVIYNKYYKNEKNFKRRERSEYFSLNNNKISQYDELIKKYALDLNWDWRLLAAQIYQESRFDPKSSSWAGAQGLMQLMPKTAKSLGVSNRSDPEQSLMGGTRYMQTMWLRFENIPDSIQRVKFTLAAYNCGYNHVQDARKLAELNSVNPNSWDEHVEEMILKLSYRENYTKPGINYGYVRGSEPHNYVRQIFKRYEQYKQFIE